MTPDRVVLGLTALWHALAVWHFTLYPARTLARSTRERPVNTIATELFRFLGGMNLALVFLAAAGAFAAPEARRLALATLAIANATQFLHDLVVRRRGLATGPFFLQIMVGDGFFAAVNAAALAAL